MASPLASEPLILVVEDDHDIRESIAEVLIEGGYDVATASDGAAALDLLHQAGRPRPALVLLDLMMPVMCGWELRQKLLEDTELAAIPVVVLSGDAHAEEKAAELCAVEALGKPISLSKLLEVVSTYCQGIKADE
jgi:CheY-like chemotaxis protein